ncbi:MAG: glycosyltransferase family 4 protein, partial [Chloroflexi bacterium]|nr:glycosyltransferase family 4 protein [Chloroflexota bacterium]
LFIDTGYQPTDPVVQSELSSHPYHRYPDLRADYDVTLYSMGDNGRYHGYMLDYIHKYPGFVIMNDLTLHRCIISQTVGQNKPHAYLDELKYAYGDLGPTIATHIGSGLGNELLLQYPLFERIVDSSLGIIVQNQYARAQILAKRPHANIIVISYPFFFPPGFGDVDQETERAKQRDLLKLAPDDLAIGSFGIFVPNKHLQSCLRAFAALLPHYPNARYILGGTAVPDYDLPGQIHRMGLDNRAIISGWLPPHQFVHQMFALDVGIHLRHPHIGGTPYTPIRLMGLGVCTIISDIEPLAELPEGACIKIKPDDYAEAILQSLLQHLATDVTLRQQIQQNGQDFITRHHDIAKNAAQTLAFFEAIN